MPRANTICSNYLRLENRLVLLAWLNSLFGYKDNRELLSNIKEAGEGFDSYGESYVYKQLAGRGDKVKIPVANLRLYDSNILNHLEAINKHRAEPITLRYFQYLSVLYTEIFLDWYFNRRIGLLRALNDFVTARNSGKPAGEAPDAEFSEADLSKLAFWMATGSGKTLIMHFNYRQFLHYNNKPLDNIILITPNEGLTAQHMEEMTASGVPCVRFSIEESGLNLVEKNAVRVIEITKLVEEKRGGGISVPVECFEGNNLIFVDEGHKGSGGEAWRRFRDALGQTGFTFEYSATFGQALTAARNDTLTAEYGKAIVFDYSYKYFHGDGYGKDFHILNLREETSEDKADLLLLGNLLSFYEQERCFDENSEKINAYNLERPLWIFVGSTVNAVYSENKKKRSDVLTVSRFLQRFMENQRAWAVRAIEKVISGRTGLKDPDGEDLFTGKFEYLRDRRLDPSDVYSDILGNVFHAPASGTLHMCDIRGSAGELGLRVGGSEDYFGLIYIGDTSAFKKLVEEDDSGIVLEEDALSGSLFEGINNRYSDINILIGAKKFMEGWNSWRVSNMGLLNIGRTEGSEIIQLFGRGVRLRGFDFSLKRSASIDGEHPPHLRLLETLNIFAVRANYMAQFREYLEREGVETEGHVTLPLKIKTSKDFLGKGLVVPRIPDGRHFSEECDILLELDGAACVSVDMSLKVQSMSSGSAGLMTATIKAGKELRIPSESLSLLDWERIYLECLEYKEQKGFSNLVVMPDTLRSVIAAEEPRLYSLIADETVVCPVSFSGVETLREAVLAILRRYIEKFYRVRQERWDSDNMIYRNLDASDPNFKDYVIKIPRSEAELISAVKQLIDEGLKIYKEETERLPNIYFDRHLYQPLLIQRGEKIKTEPPGLNDSEKHFVEDVRDYARREADKSLAKKEIFLLRNLSRGKGIGFFDNEGFYPDFILWIKEGNSQRIVFVEPHGMMHEKTYWTSDKAKLHERLKKLSHEWGDKVGMKNVKLDSYIVSRTPYDQLREFYGKGNWSRKKLKDLHILFFERSEEYDYISYLFV